MIDLNEFFAHCLPRGYAEYTRNGDVCFYIKHPTREYTQPFMITRNTWLRAFTGDVTNDEILQNDLFRHALIRCLEKFTQGLREKDDLECVTTTEYLKTMIVGGKQS